MARPKFVKNPKKVLKRSWSLHATFALALANAFVESIPAFHGYVGPFDVLTMNLVGFVIVAFLRILDQGLTDGE